MIKFLIPALLGLSLLANSALAQSEDVAVRVEYRDLNLKNPAGLALLDRRIARAIAEVCPNNRRGDLTERLAEVRCRRAKLAQVSPQRTRILAGGLAQPAGLALN